MSVIDSTRKQRALSSANSAVSPDLPARAPPGAPRLFASVYRNGFAELARDAQQLVAMLVADADGERHRDDAAAHRRPEAVEELLVVAEEDDHLVAALRAHRLQVMQDPERARIDLAVAARGARHSRLRRR